MAVEVQTDSNGKTVTLSVSGRFDYSTHGEFRKAYQDTAGDGTTYVIDLAETEYIDSSGLGMLLVLKEFAGGEKADVQIVDVRPEVRRILEIANFDRLFRMG